MNEQEKTIREAAAAMGRKGGRARADKLTPERRSEIAKLGGEAAKKALDAKVASR